jgi:hypothetical protein
LSGSAYIFKWDGTSWVEQQKLTASDGDAEDRFGHYVSISGDLAIVGADYDEEKGTNSGSAYIFKRDGTSWIEQQPKLVASDGAAGDSFGASVSISGDYAIVGADGSDDDDKGTDTGSAYIFKWDGSSWVEQQPKLTAQDGTAYDYFGASVSISGNLAIVGCRYDDDNGTNSGSAYIFENTCYTEPECVATWKVMDTPTSEHLRDVWGTSSDNVYAVGNSGTILHYDGCIWEKISSQMSTPLVAYMFGVSGSGPDDVYFVGHGETGSSIVLRYSGGDWQDPDAWEILPMPDVPYWIILEQIWVSGSHVFAAGVGWDGKGHIIQWENGILLSHIQKVGPKGGGYFDGIWGRNPYDVYATMRTGYSGDITALIYHYDGNTWDLIFYPDGLGGESDMPLTRAIGGIWGSNDSSDDLFLAAESFGSSNWLAQVLYYDGNDWQTEIFDEYPQCHAVQDVWGTASDNVYVVGDYGIILHGGSEFVWSVMDSESLENLNGIWGTDDGSDVFVVGHNGTILRLGCEPANTAPIADAGQDQQVSTGPDGEAAVILDGSASYDPDCDELTYTWLLDCQEIATGIEPTIFLPCGSYTIELIVNDSQLDSEPNCVEITVLDGTPPEIICPENITLEYPADTDPTNTGQATATDNCDDSPSITYNDVSIPGCGKTEVITRTWIATDECGNSSSCDQTITVEDTTAPEFTIVPEDADAECDGNSNAAELDAWLNSVSAEDLCGEVTITNDFTSLSDDCGATGSATVTWTATDECGNTATTSATFTIVDTTAPLFSVSPVDKTVECDGSGNSTDLQAWLNSVSAEDVCGDVTITNDFTSLSDDCGATGFAIVVWTATDDCGNIATTSPATFTIVDTTAPTITCPPDVELTYPADTSVEANGSATAEDICSDVTITHSDVTVPGCGKTEVITRTWTATDECGNSSTCDQIIEVINQAPVADADGPYIALATGWDGALVPLSGTFSYDPDEDILEYEWDLDLSVDSDGDGDPTNDVDSTEPSPVAQFPIGQTEIGLVVVDECGAVSQQDITTVTVSVIEVAIEIRADDGLDTINLGSSGVVRVAFLTDDFFDALTVNPLTVTLRGEDFNDGLVKFRSKNEDVPMTEIQDIDDDGDIDFVVNLDTELLADYEFDAFCAVAALTYDGYVVDGVDAIHIAPEEGLE